jgi:putative tryptophan/tyrosine transport system substrate-binding protein
MTRCRLGLFVSLALTFAVAPLAAEAQPAGQVGRIGVLERTSMALNAANLAAFGQGLREFGYVEGHNLVIDYRYAEGRDERLADLATELVRLPAGLLLRRGAPAALAVKTATGTIPVVMAASGDPLGTGRIAASRARAGMSRD